MGLEESRKESRALAETLAHAALDLKGENVRILDVSELIFITDLFVIITSQSARQTSAIAESLKAVAKGVTGSKGMSEGTSKSTWLLCDFHTVVVHILTEEAREFYALDDLWADAEQIFPAAETGATPV